MTSVVLNFQEVFFHLNYQLMKHSPISRNFYVLNQIFETLSMNLIPLTVILGFKDITEFDKYGSSPWITNFFQITSMIGIILNSTIFLMYIGLLIFIKKQNSANQNNLFVT